MSDCSPPVSLSLSPPQTISTNLFQSPKTKCDIDNTPYPVTEPLYKIVTPHNNQPITIASHFLDNEPSRKSVRLSQSIVNYSRPAELKLIPLNSTHAFVIFARLNNGIRRAFSDFYDMVEGMCRIVKEMHIWHLKLFFRWWQIFASFLSASLDAYKDLLLPWVQRKVQLPDSVTVDHAKDLCKSIKIVLDILENLESKITRRSPDETVRKIIKAVSAIPILFKYLIDVEKHIPALVEEHFTQKEILITEKHLANFLHKNGVPQCRRMHLLVLARGMTSEVAAWKNFLSFHVRMSSWAQSSKFQANYVEVVQKLSSLKNSPETLG